MKKLFIWICQFYIYGSFHISLASFLFVLESFYLVDYKINWTYCSLVFFGSIVIYSSHRLIGLEKIEKKRIQNRFSIISKLKKPINITVVIGLIGCIVSAIHLDIKTITALIIPGFISFLYISPLFKNGKRLRDYNYIKVFLIAFTWGYLSIAPFLFIGDYENTLFILLIIFIEKCLYILAVTLPFDIRDLRIDEMNDVLTIPKRIGLKHTYKIIYGLLVLGLLLMIIISLSNNINSYAYSFSSLMIYLLTFILIEKSRGKQNDVYFSGWIDGMIILRSVILIFTLSIS